MEHYSDLFSKQNTVSASALNAIKFLLTMDVLDAETTLGMLSRVIDSMPARKVPVSDEIPPDLVKRCKTILLPPLTVLGRMRCTTGHERRQDHHTLQNEGWKSDCNNYRRISLPSIVGKIYARVIFV